MSATATAIAQTVTDLSPEEVRTLNAKLGKKLVIKTMTHFAVAVVAVVGTILVCNKLENDPADENDENDNV